MELDEQLAEILYNKLTTLLKKKVVLFNAHGEVMASPDLAEMGKNYEEIRKAINSKVTAEPSDLGGKKPNGGVIIPLTYSDENLGAVFLEEKLKEYQSYAQVLRATIELLVHQTIAMDHFPYKDKIKDNFVFGLLHRELQVQDTKVREEADLLELQLNRDKVVMVINIKNFWQLSFGDNVTAAEDEKQSLLSSYKKEIFQAVNRFFGRLSGCTVAYFGSDVFVVLIDELYDVDGRDMVEQLRKRSSEFQQILKERLGAKFPKVSIAIGSFYRGKDGPALAFEEASRAMDLGLTAGDNRSFYHIDDFGMLATLAGGNKKWQSDFVRRLTEKMQGNEYLLETMEIFFNENMNLTQTAKSLKIHRNTLLYRLDKISKITSLDPRKFNDAMELKVALTLNRMLNSKV